VALMTKNFGAEIRVATDTAYTLEREADELWRADDKRLWRLKSAEARAAGDVERALRRQAAAAFAELNGWRAAKHDFALSVLARGGVHNCWRGFHYEGADTISPHWALDHAVHFRELAPPYRSAAIVGQPYATPVESVQRLAAELGLVLHVPPNLSASWWNPGWTFFFVFTRPGTPVRFLPEQSAESEQG
jgi:hypothetical protein